MAKKSQSVSKSLSFEGSIEELEQIVQEMESGELSLKDSLNKFEKGIKLYKDCVQELGKAEKKVKVLTESLKEVDLED